MKVGLGVVFFVATAHRPRRHDHGAPPAVAEPAAAAAPAPPAAAGAALLLTEWVRDLPSQALAPHANRLAAWLLAAISEAGAVATDFDSPLVRIFSAAAGSPTVTVVTSCPRRMMVTRGKIRNASPFGSNEPPPIAWR